MIEFDQQLIGVESVICFVEKLQIDQGDEFDEDYDCEYVQ